MLRVLSMVSGGGTNLQAIIDSVKNGMITNTELVGVISNNKNAYALTRAKENGIDAKCISPKDYESREVFNQELLKAVDAYEPDLIVLAGYLVVIPPEMIKKYKNRIINIHPSLIPSSRNIFINSLLWNRLLWIESTRGSFGAWCESSWCNSTFRR